MLSIYRELLWIASFSLDADSNLVSWRVESRFVPQNAQRHARELVGQRYRRLIAMHAFDCACEPFTEAKFRPAMGLHHDDLRRLYEQHSKIPAAAFGDTPQYGLNRPGFTGEDLVQMLGCFFMFVQGFIEELLCFVRRDIADGAVKPLGVVPVDPFQRFPFKLAH